MNAITAKEIGLMLDLSFEAKVSLFSFEGTLYYRADEVHDELKKAYREGYREGTVASNDLIEELRKENGDLHVRFEAMSEQIAELVEVLDRIDDQYYYAMDYKDLVLIGDVLEKVRG